MRQAKVDLLFIVCGIGALLIAVIPPWMVGPQYQSGESAMEVGFPALGVTCPMLLAAFSGLIHGRSTATRLFHGLSGLAIASLFTLLALTNQVLSLFYFRPLFRDPGIGYWTNWIPMIGLTVILWGADRIPVLGEVTAPISGVAQGSWVAVPDGTMSMSGELVPASQWLHTESIVGRTLTLRSSDGRGYRIVDVSSLVAYREESQR